MAAQSNGVITPVVFDFNSLSIRAIADEFSNPWFVAKDVCAILGHSRPGIAVKDHCRQDGTTKRCIIDRLGREQETLLINEGNLYRLIIRSKKPEAERFGFQRSGRPARRGVGVIAHVADDLILLAKPARPGFGLHSVVPELRQRAGV